MAEDCGVPEVTGAPPAPVPCVTAPSEAASAGGTCVSAAGGGPPSVMVAGRGPHPVGGGSPSDA